MVYSFRCSQEGCQSLQYIGYTTCTLGQRFRGHSYKGSILNHIKLNHKGADHTAAELLKSVKILYRGKEKNELKIAEALLIKQFQPKINSQTEFSQGMLRVF